MQRAGGPSPASWRRCAPSPFIVGQLTDGISSVVRLAFFVGALFWLQWELALASLIPRQPGRAG
ncbi:MAG: hypothetical protein ACRDO0_03160, partial [Nocardioidaceae bacterium]